MGSCRLERVEGRRVSRVSSGVAADDSEVSACSDASWVGSVTNQFRIEDMKGRRGESGIRQCGYLSNLDYTYLSAHLTGGTVKIRLVEIIEVGPCYFVPS